MMRHASRAGEQKRVRSLVNPSNSQSPTHLNLHADPSQRFQPIPNLPNSNQPNFSTRGRAQAGTAPPQGCGRPTTTLGGHFHAYARRLHCAQTNHTQPSLRSISVVSSAAPAQPQRRNLHRPDFSNGTSMKTGPSRHSPDLNHPHTNITRPTQHQSTSHFVPRQPTSTSARLSHPTLHT